jgi:ABC-type branched-subunit amino acid transport system ATPase component
VIDEGETVFDGPPESIREREDLMDMYLALES